jgi:hypothetical protein
VTHGAASAVAALAGDLALVVVGGSSEKSAFFAASPRGFRVSVAAWAGTSSDDAAALRALRVITIVPGAALENQLLTPFEG